MYIGDIALYIGDFGLYMGDFALYIGDIVHPLENPLSRCKPFWFTPGYSSPAGERFPLDSSLTIWSRSCLNRLDNGVSLPRIPTIASIRELAWR